MTAFEEALCALRGKKVAVLGIGVSNTPLLRLLVSAGAVVTACDKKSEEELGARAAELRALGVGLYTGPDYLDGVELSGAEVVFRTPGMRPDLPALERARLRGARVTSEMEVFFSVCPCPIIAVTGSDGKTTTTTLIAEMLRGAGRTVWLGGNIGTPLLDKTGEMSPGDICVLELSSFQLMSMRQSPHIAVVTNLAPNHLDVHRDMEEYIDAKRRIFRFQSPEDVLVLNLDNDITRSFAAESGAEVRFFSRLDRPVHGVWLENGRIVYDGGELMRKEDIRIPGEHNVENYMAACAAVAGLAPPAVMQKVAREFAGVEHRLELVRAIGGAAWYNDSIASSPTRAIAGLRCFGGPIVLIAGGYDKHIPFDELGREICARVDTLLLCGATADKIEAAVQAAAGEKKPRIFRLENLEDTVQKAYALAKPGDTVLFSPACASFDQFPNFMKRGERFKELVRALPGGEEKR